MKRRSLSVSGLLALFQLSLPLITPLPAEEDRGIAVVAVGGEDLSIGAYHFLGIGIDQYQAPQLALKTAVKGATELRDLVVAEFAFEKPNCRLLLDAQATEDGIVGALRTLAETAGEKDSVLIYYAGHGNLDKLTNTGSWVPWDATFQTPGKWIDNDRVRKLLKAMKARHALLISDSCFAGDFFRGDTDIVLPTITDDNIRRAFTRMSRKAMTAGGLEPVADGGQEGHSIYTWWLLKSLRETPDPYIIPEQVHDRLKKAVASNAKQNPLYGFLHDAGGDPDGSFVFFRRGTKGLDAAMQDKLKRIEEMKKLDKEAAEKALRQQQEIASKQAQLEALDARLAELRKKVGAGNAGQTEFDEMVAIAEQRTRQGEELEALRKKAEEDLRRKEEELAEARRKQEEQQYTKLQGDLQSFGTKVQASKYVDDAFKRQAWNALCRKWGVAETTPLGSELTYAEGKVHVGKGPVISVAGGQKFKNSVGMEMVPIPAGEFQMGSNDGGRMKSPSIP